MSKLFLPSAFVLAVTAANAADLPACSLSSTLVASALERSRVSSQSATSLVVSGALRNGTAITYAKDDPVLVVDLQVVRSTPAVIPPVNVLLRSSWPLSPSFRFAAGQILPTPREIDGGGRLYRVLTLSDRSVLLIDSDGWFCNKVANARTSPPVWMVGTLSQEPDDVQLESKVVEEPGENGSLRIIFNGLNSGQMSFQEVWVNGATILSSTTRNFDQFARSVKIGPFTFEVVEAAAGRVTLRYDVSERAPVTAADLAKMPLRRGR